MRNIFLSCFRQKINYHSNGCKIVAPNALFSLSQKLQGVIPVLRHWDLFCKPIGFLHYLLSFQCMTLEPVFFFFLDSSVTHWNDNVCYANYLQITMFVQLCVTRWNDTKGWTTGFSCKQWLCKEFNDKILQGYFFYGRLIWKFFLIALI